MFSGMRQILETHWERCHSFLLILPGIHVTTHGIGRNVLPHLGNLALRHIDKVAGLKAEVFMKITGIQHPLYVDQMRFRYICGNPAEKNDLRMTGLLREPAGNRDRFVYWQVSSQLILSWPRHFAGSEEVGPVKTFKRRSDLGFAP